ncbi:AraC family transcriptional regulator [Litoribacillus peritrichatus]
MDKLSAVLNQFSITTGVFYSGKLCGTSSFDSTKEQEGHLHFLESGSMRVTTPSGKLLNITEPSVLFYPKPSVHELRAEQGDDANVVCATIRYGTGSNNPLANALPPFVAITLSDDVALKNTAQWLFEEALQKRQGREAIMNRLTEIFLITLLRHAMDSDLVDQGLLTGLAHPQLAKVITALHARPSENWTLQEMASLATMSRSKFIETFKEKVGYSPGDYLLEWRVGVAQTLLKKGKPVGWVANEVGYENASALARVFRKKTGQSPREWLTLNQVAE